MEKYVTIKYMLCIWIYSNIAVVLHHPAPHVFKQKLATDSSFAAYFSMHKKQYETIIVN